MPLARLAARTLIGGLFIGHGTQKLFGWFGGHGLEATGEAFGSMGLRPGRQQALLAGGSEALGGALLAAGIATPLAGTMLTGVMLGAVRQVHLRNGPWVTNGGWEYNAVLIAAVLLLVEEGPGPWSVDAALGIERSGRGWAIGALAAGLAGSAAALELAKRTPPPAPESADQAPPVETLAA